MKTESAVEFATESRIHIALAVADLEKSVAFYRTLFGQSPTKTKPGYAKFEVAGPPVNLALNAFGGTTGPNNPVAHYGVQVKSVAAVEVVARRLREAGLATLGLHNVEFVEAGIEKPPLPDDSVDVVTSNGVFNLCPDKPRVLAEAFRVLRPDGRLQMADILLHDDVTPEQLACLGEWSD